MDPVANLREQLELSRKIIDLGDRRSAPRGVAWEDDCLRLAELVVALDEWRKKGGFDPYGSLDLSAPIAALVAACAAHPTQRLLQVIGNVFPGDSFYVEDEQAAEQLREYAALGGRTVNVNLAPED